MIFLSTPIDARKLLKILARKVISLVNSSVYSTEIALQWSSPFSSCQQVVERYPDDQFRSAAAKDLSCRHSSNPSYNGDMLVQAQRPPRDLPLAKGLVFYYKVMRRREEAATALLLLW